MPPVVYGSRSGTTALPSRALMIGPPTVSRQLQNLVAGVEAAAARENGDFRSLIDQRGGLREQFLRGNGNRGGEKIGAVRRDVGGGALALGIPVLHVLRDGDVRDGAIAERGLDRFVNHIDDVVRPGDALVVGGDIHVELVEIDILLVVRADQIVKGVAGDGEHGLAVALGIVEAVEQMNAARARTWRGTRRGGRCTSRSRRRRRPPLLRAAPG